MVTDERMEKALNYLIDTDDSAAEAKANVERAKYAAKLVRQRVFLLSDKTSVAAKEADAEVHKDTQDAEARIADNIVKFAKLDNRRETARIVIDLYRTQQANRRVGSV